MAGTPRNRGLVRQWRLVRALAKDPMGLTFAQLIAVANEPVCERTIRRDVDTLTVAGFPMEVVSGGQVTRVCWRRGKVE